MKTLMVALLTFLVLLGNELLAQNPIVKEAWVKKYASGLAPKFDEATAIAVDDSGNVYVTGSSSGQLSKADYLTVKYNSAGIQIWTARYNGESNDEDFPSAICVDVSGNIYVSGKSKGVDSSFDYLTVKYNSTGTQEWIVRYNGLANSNDEAAAMAHDNLGNVYVTGKSEGIGVSYDYATVKYNHAGIQQWVARYNGPENLIDAATAISVASASTGENEVYVTGASQVAVGSCEYTTLKYNSAGIQQWIARYKGIGNSENQSVALAVDNNGNVYVTGWSAGTSSGLDYATVKYDNAGNGKWVARYNGQGNSNDKPVAIAIDRTGNIYVTGSELSARFSGDRDYATVKYNNEGVEQWVERFNGTVGYHDEAVGLAVDAAGDIYVTGYSLGFNVANDYVTIKYNSAGVLQWTARYNSSSEKYEDYAVALAINKAGEIFVTGTSRNYGADIDFDFTTVKYNANGSRLWDVHHNSDGNFKDEAVDIIADEAGNVYVTGWSLASNSSRDYATIKYNSSGELQWLARYNGPGNSFDEPVAIATDGVGNVYVTGRSVSAVANFKYKYDFATVKYNHNGEEQWVARYRASENSFDAATALALDNAGNVYVAGISNQNPVTIKYNNAGIQQWIARYNGLGDAIALALDASDNIYVLSRFQLLIKYSNTGVQLWARKGPPNAVGFAVDDSGNVYATGWFELQHGYSYYITQKFNRAGDQQWETRYEHEYHTDNVTTAIATDVAGNVYVTGFSSVDYATIKYNHAGVMQWIARYKGPGNFFYNPADLTLDNKGNIYITASNNGDYVTIKYDNNGTQQWVARYSDAQSTSDRPRALFVDKLGNVYVTGTSEYRQTSSIRYESIYTTIKYTQTTPVAVDENETTIPQDFCLFQNYPNPFNPSTTIRYALPKSEYVTLKIYNLIGKEIATLVRGKKVAGEYQVHWDASDLPGGLYIYRLQAGEYAENKKLVLLK